MSSGPVYINTFSQDVEYDYIIVGTGSAGCVLVNRLTEHPNTTLLLLEAGPVDTDPNMHIPFRYFDIQNASINWKFKTVPQKESSFFFQISNQPGQEAKYLVVVVHLMVCYM